MGLTQRVVVRLHTGGIVHPHMQLGVVELGLVLETQHGRGKQKLTLAVPGGEISVQKRSTRGSSTMLLASSRLAPRRWEWLRAPGNPKILVGLQAPRPMTAGGSMIAIYVAIDIDGKAASKLSITLDDSDSSLGEIDVENLVTEVHARLWRYAQTWDHKGIAITIKSEVLNDSEG